MNGTRKRILFLAEGATLTHFARPLVLADALHPSAYEIRLYAPERYAPYLTRKPYFTGTLECQPQEQFLGNIARGRSMFSEQVLREYVEQDRNLIREFQPDLVVSDMRMSAAVSARLEAVRCATLMNAYWSPFAEERYILPELPITRVIPPRSLNPLYRAIAPLAHRPLVAEMNSIRAENGLSALPAHLPTLYTQGDYVLYPDPAEFIPTSKLPSNHAFIGPCDWTPELARPDWWNKMLDDPKPKVFVALGSSGPVRVLPQLLKVLHRLPVSVLLATSGRVQVDTSDNLYAANLLPFAAAASVADLIVSHGGSSGVYPALTAGTPVLAIPSNADQMLSSALLCESGAGLQIRVEEVTSSRFERTLAEMLNDACYREAAKKWQCTFAKYDSGQLFRDFVDRVLT